MSLRGLSSLVRQLPGYLNIVRDLHAGRAEMVTGPAEKPLLLSSLWQSVRRPILVVSPRPEAARRIYDQLCIYFESEYQPLFFPEPEVLSYEFLSADHATNSERLRVLESLANIPNTTPSIIVASVGAVLCKTLSMELFRKISFSLSTGQTIHLRKLMEHLVNIGYRRESSVDIPGTFSLRGGILDIFSPNEDLPVRLDMAGDEIETLNLFDPLSQRSVQKTDMTKIVPAQEILPSIETQESATTPISDLNFSNCTSDMRAKIEDDLTMLFSGNQLADAAFYNGFINHTSLLDYMPQRTPVVLEDEIALEIESGLIEQRIQEIQNARLSQGELPANFPSSNFNWSEFKERCKIHPQVAIKAWDGMNKALGFETPPSFYGNLNEFTSTVRDTQRSGGSVTVVSRHSKRIAEILQEADIGATIITDIYDLPRQGDVRIISGYLEQGWQVTTTDNHHFLYTDLETFGIIKERRTSSLKRARRTPVLSQLNIGSYVVHEDHGIARFSGTTSLDASGDDREYLVLEYAEKDRIYIPTDQLDRISPYVGSSDRPPKLTRLDSFEWSRAKQRVKESTQEMAKDMLDLYAKRQVAKGHSFASDTVWQQEMEDAFPFEETEDQARTIDEVKNDMELVRPMDRLVCGDVGYGKTEVALRAAFKSVNDGRQVAMLVPTTILAQQHYATFTARLSPYPVTIEVLSRFRSKKEQKDIVDGLKRGAVDIVIGTHRLVQKDVQFKDLGLVLVDEEQRFGVNHKESLKRLRREVDFLTLSATPIPRTLYMALSGIRDMSTMESPPEERFPIKTYVGEYSDEIIKEAILRELERDGQVFFLHNRIRSIQRVAEHLRSLIPEARVSVAHGRMGEEDLETQMLAFNNGEVDVLVCTTIIESGLDIPNANTLIIDRADRFGLAQLYQLRGRVGRSRTGAYCYLLAPKRQHMTDEAGKRLRAILEASELGSGYRIAMRDLEIRGAGNILGAEQSGYIHAIGFELYTRLLNQAITELRVEQGDADETSLNPSAEVRIDLPLSAYIPQDYVSHLPTRLAVYQRLTSLRTQEQVDDLRNELRDRFGPLPETVENLFYIVSSKITADHAFVKSITASNGMIILTLKGPVGGASTVIHKALGDSATVGHQQIRLNQAHIGTNWTSTLQDILQKLKQFQETLPLPSQR